MCDRERRKDRKRVRARSEQTRGKEEVKAVGWKKIDRMRDANTESV